jgi:hypothetical protein
MSIMLKAGCGGTIVLWGHAEEPWHAHEAPMSVSGPEHMCEAAGAEHAVDDCAGRWPKGCR